MVTKYTQNKRRQRPLVFAHVKWKNRAFIILIIQLLQLDPKTLTFCPFSDIRCKVFISTLGLMHNFLLIAMVVVVVVDITGNVLGFPNTFGP